jgi:hypothetical protein
MRPSSDCRDRPLGSRACLLVCAAATYFVLGTPSAAAVVIDAPGHWSLERLGYGKGAQDVTRQDTSYPETVRARHRVFRYSLRRDAAQGGESWYTMRLHYRIRFARGAGPGTAYVIGQTNGLESVLIEYEIKRSGAARRIEWRTDDWVNGDRHGKIRSGRMRTANFLQIHGVRPGDNFLTVKVEEYGRARVEEMRVFPDSGIHVGSRSPARLKLTVAAQDRPVHVGDKIELRLALDNTGGYPARQVEVGAFTDGRVATATDGSVLRFKRVDRRVTGTLALRATKPGVGKVGVRAAGVTNESREAVATISVYRSVGASRWENVARKLLLLIVFVPALVVLLAPWRLIRAAGTRR